MKKYLCEFLGTCVLVLFGCGVAVFTEADLVATSLAFGLSIVAVAYTIGKVSGCHVNPAVSFAMWIDKRISGKDFFFYVLAQTLGAIVGSLLLILIMNCTTIGDFTTVGLGQNTFASTASNGITMLGALVTEIILTFVFVFAVLGVTKEKKNDAVAPIVIGLTLTLVHILGIKLTGTSVNPARSFAPALLIGLKSNDLTLLTQVWVFIVGPLVGAAFAALASFFVDVEPEPKKEETKKEEQKKEIKTEETFVVKAEKPTSEKTPKKTTKTTTKKTTKPKTTKTKKETK